MRTLTSLLLAFPAVENRLKFGWNRIKVVEVVDVQLSWLGWLDMHFGLLAAGVACGLGRFVVRASQSPDCNEGIQGGWDAGMDLPFPAAGRTKTSETYDEP